MSRSNMAAIMTLGVCLVLVVVTLTQRSQRSESDTSPQPSTPTLIKEIAGSWGGEITKSFPAGSGLTAHVVTISEFDVRVLYSTDDGQKVLIGDLLSAAGDSLSRKHSQENTPEIDFSQRFDTLLAATAESSLITGTRPSTLTVVYEPNCGFCRQFYQLASPTGIQVRWIPVGFLSDQSNHAAAALLEGRGQADAVMAAAQTPEGVDQLAASNPAESKLADVAANWAALQSLGVNGTPTLIWRDQDGKVTVHRSMVQAEEWAKIMEAAAIKG